MATVLGLASAPERSVKVLVVLETGKDRYQQLGGTRLRSARLVAGWSQARLAVGMTDVLGVAVSERHVIAWEEGIEPMTVGDFGAALDVMGVTAAELLGVDNPDVVQMTRLAASVAKVRGLLNDPAALMRRATELLEGTAKPLLVVAVVGLTALRVLISSPVPNAHLHPYLRRVQPIATQPVPTDESPSIPS